MNKSIEYQWSDETNETITGPMTILVEEGTDGCEGHLYLSLFRPDDGDPGEAIFLPPAEVLRLSESIIALFHKCQPSALHALLRCVQGAIGKPYVPDDGFPDAGTLAEKVTWMENSPENAQRLTTARASYDNFELVDIRRDPLDRSRIVLDATFTTRGHTRIY